MPHIATTKLHIGDAYYNAGDLVPDNDQVHEDLLPLIESGDIIEGEPVSEAPSGTMVQIVATARLEKYNADGDVSADERLADPLVEPDEVVVGTPNALTIGGGSAVIELLTGQTFTHYGSANAYLSVGDSTTAFANTQTDLQAATNKTRKTATASHTDSTSSSGSLTATWVATYATTDANHRWREWGIFNASTSGRMLSRKVEDLDGGSAKTSAQAWQLTVTWTLA